MISNCRGSTDRSGGDQSGTEYRLQKWYSGGWNYVLRHPNPEIQKAIAKNAIAAALNDKIGYSQATRYTFWEELQKVGYDASKITTPCNADCSSSTTTICKAAGFIARDEACQKIPICTTSTMCAALTAAGFRAFQDVKYTQSEQYLQPGDILLNSTQHACINVGDNTSVEISVESPSAETTSASVQSTVSSIISMFASKYEIGDALVREFCYINPTDDSTTEEDDRYARTLKQHRFKLSCINYAPLVEDIAEAKGVYKQSSIYTANSGINASNYSVNSDALSGNAKIIFDFLTNKGLNPAAACGVLGNIYHESSCNPACIGDHGTSFGICQWHSGRGIAMKQFVGTNWSNNLSGQCEYLWHDLTVNYSSTINHLKSVSNDEAGAKSAADFFVRHFEIPANIDKQTVIRQSKAAEYFNSLVINTNEIPMFVTHLSSTQYTTGDIPTITLSDIEKCKDRKAYLEMVTPVYAYFCQSTGIHFPGILALQTIWESGMPNRISVVARNDNNLGGLKYPNNGRTNIPNATKGSKVPKSEQGHGLDYYCRFANVTQYYQAHVYNLTKSAYDYARIQTNLTSFTRCLCNMWVIGTKGYGPAAYSEEIISAYKQYNLSRYEV